MPRISFADARGILGCTAKQLYSYAKNLKPESPKPGHTTPTFDEDAVRALAAERTAECNKKAAEATGDHQAVSAPAKLELAADSRVEAAPIARRAPRVDGSHAPKVAHK